MKKRSNFSLSNYKLGTADMGKLVPINLIDVLPGDTIQLASTALLRFQPMLAPVMHPINVKIHHWFVPYRLVWDNFEDFITGNKPDAVFPFLTANSTGTLGKGQLSDYFGISPNTAASLKISSLPFRAYNLIWNEFYRDQDLQLEAANSTADGSDDDINTRLFRSSPYNVAWSKDYFNTARPWTQKGPQITIPVQATGTLAADGPFTLFNSANIGGSNTPYDPHVLPKPIKIPTTQGTKQVDTDLTFGLRQGDAVFGGSTYKSGLKLAEGGVGANIDILKLRVALGLQRFQEARANYGSRYVEYLRSLGVKSSDGRLGLPEYLGGSQHTIQISDVMQTAGADGGVVGSLKGKGTGIASSKRIRRFFDEHGLVMSFMIVRPAPMYADALDKMWLKNTKEEFYQRELEHIGMQAVEKTQVYSGSTPGEVFGYQNQYDEYRTSFSSICGDMRDTLDFWHLARKFDKAPELNGDFVRCEPSKRIFAEQTTQPIIFMCSNSVQAKRLVSQRSKPMTF